MASSIVLQTECGDIVLRLLPESAPQTVAYISNIVKAQLYDGATFYRSDFVIQFGLHEKPERQQHPYGNMTVNETSQNQVISNSRGTAALAHFDVPDCGGTEIFINLQDNSHLDQAYGGFCVFAKIDTGTDSTSVQTMDAIAASVKKQGRVVIQKAFMR